MEKLTIEEFNKKIHELDFDSVSVNEMYDLIEAKANLIKNYADKPKDERPLSLIYNDEMLMCDAFQMHENRYPNLPGDDFHRGTLKEGSILCKDDSYSTVFITLFVNGNNGTTVVSDESLQPIIDYIRYVEHKGGKAFISGASYRSDIYYYCVTTIFWKK